MLHVFRNVGKKMPKYLCDTENPFFVAMFLNGLHDQSAYTRKISASGLYKMKPVELMKKIRELESLGLFSKMTTQAVQITGPQVDVPSRYNPGGASRERRPHSYPSPGFVPPHRNNRQGNGFF